MKGKIIAIISFLSIFFIGFIGWGFSSNAFNNAYAKHMINKKFIDINNITFSDYCVDGFVNDYVIENKAILSFDINIDLNNIIDNYGDFFIDNDSLSFEVILSYENVSYSYFDIISNSKVEIYSDSIISSYEVNKKIINSFVLVNGIDSKKNEILKINMIYRFDISEYIYNSSFENKVYDLMVNKGIPLNIKVLLK